MTMQITIEVSDKLGKRLLNMRERLPEVLERGYRETIATDTAPATFDENAIIELLASQPSPENILAIRPSSEFQTRTSQLIEKSKRGMLSSEEDQELNRYLVLEHIVRLAKMHAYKQLAQQE